jgi:hypothetical protein
MTAQTRPASSPFLAFVGESERNPLHVALWAALGVPLAALGLIMLAGLLQAIDPHLLAAVNDAAGGRGHHQLLWFCQALLEEAFLALILGAALLGSAKLAFQREAWTFVTPARRFDFRHMALGFGLFALVFALRIAMAEAMDGVWSLPPIADIKLPTDERAVFGLVLVPFLLIAGTASTIVFRGVLLQISSAFATSRLGLCLANGLAYALLRFDFDPLQVLGFIALGATLAWSVLELGGLEFSLGATFGANLVGGLLLPPPGDSPRFKLSDLLQVDSWMSFAMTLATCALTLVAIYVIKRRLSAREA